MRFYGWQYDRPTGVGICQQLESDPCAVDGIRYCVSFDYVFTYSAGTDLDTYIVVKQVSTLTINKQTN